MRDVQQVLWGIFAALVSIALIFGVFSLSLAEGGITLPTSTQSITIIATPTKSTYILSPTVTITQQTSPYWSVSPIPLSSTPSPTWTLTPSPEPTSCTPPPGWLPYTVKPGDTLDSLALRYKTTSNKISQANCLVTTSLTPGLVIYLPPMSTRTPAPCGAPSNWVIYIVQPLDTLYHLGQVYGIPYTDIQRANCLTSTAIHVGQQLYVPPWAPHTPTPTWFFATDTPFGFLTDTPTDTPFGFWTDTPAETVTTEPSPLTDTAIPPIETPTP